MRARSFAVWHAATGWLVVLSMLALSPSSAMTQHTRPVHGGWAVAPTAPIKLHVASGDVLVTGWSRDSVHLEGEMAEGETLFALGAWGGLKLGAEGRTVRGASRLRVFVPSRADLTVRSGSAAVEVSGLLGAVDIGVADGSVRVEGAPSTLTIEALSGDVQVEAPNGTRHVSRGETANTAPAASPNAASAAASIGALRVRTTRGRITVRGHIQAAQLATVSGVVDVSAAPLPALRVSTVSGNVHLVTASTLTAPVQVETFGGSVYVTRPRGTTTEQLHSDTGEVMRNGQRVAATNISPSSAVLLTVRSFRGTIVVNDTVPR